MTDDQKDEITRLHGLPEYVSALPSCKIEGGEIFVIFDGVKIARRGHPGTLQGRTWVSLEPGFVVHGGTEADPDLVVERNGVALH
jgi:hypothetical protein